MTDPRYDKGSAPKVISAYRRRQERVGMLLPFLWIGAMLFVVGAGYLIYRFLLPQAPLAAGEGTHTPTASETVAPGTPMATSPAPTASEPVDLAGTPVPTEAASTIITYTIQEGDTLAGIAAWYGVGLPTIAALNPLVTPEFLNVGDQLSIPVPGESGSTVTPTSAGPQEIVEYQVQSGDTLAAIAIQFGSTIEAIVQENNLESPDQIQEGQTLRIPVESGAAPSATPGEPGSTSEITSTPSPEG